MKIKRFDNLWLMGVIISGAILGIIYLLKIFFPSFVIEVAHIESIVNIGHYIDQHKWAWYLASFGISFLLYYLLCCASCRKKHLARREVLFIIATILILFIVREFLPNQYTVLNYTSLLVLPLIMKGDFLITTVWFATTNLLQTTTLEIRNLNQMISDYNFATGLILLIDLYIFQFLLYFYFNYKKEE
jgi:hypothetical protein